MNMKKRAIAIVIFLFLLVAFGIVYIFSELYTESEMPEDTPSDAEIFKEEYEKINDTEVEDGKKYRNLTIPKDNPIIYSKAENIAKLIEDKESFIVYFGFAKCPWCRSMLPSLLDAAKENDVDKIYYVDILSIRDKYELNDKHQAVKVVEGTEGYYKLLKSLDPVLENYESLTYKTSKGKTKKVKISEKRIYAPSVVAVKNGMAMGLENGISEKQKDAYMELTEEMQKEMKYKLKCLFDLLKEEDNSACICVNKKC